VGSKWYVGTMGLIIEELRSQFPRMVARDMMAHLLVQCVLPFACVWNHIPINTLVSTAVITLYETIKPKNLNSTKITLKTTSMSACDTRLVSSLLEPSLQDIRVCYKQGMETVRRRRWWWWWCCCCCMAADGPWDGAVGGCRRRSRSTGESAPGRGVVVDGG
jgi:hypothetical protein